MEQKLRLREQVLLSMSDDTDRFIDSKSVHVQNTVITDEIILECFNRVYLPYTMRSFNPESLTPESGC